MASNDTPPLRSATAIPAPPPHLPSKGGSYVISKPGAKPKRKQFTHQIGEVGHANTTKFEASDTRPSDGKTEPTKD